MLLNWDRFFTCIAVIHGVIKSASTVHHIENCTLLPSELGPDWYKVPRPVPAGFQDRPAYEPSYMHMPCAASTVFDIGVCGCTNLMSFIFKFSKRTVVHDKEDAVSGKIAPDDLVKRVDEKSTPIPPSGSLLINTRTGEVKKCPFRASSRGAKWYMIREPRDKWRAMQCAAGTIFNERSCTCVHELMASREPSKPDDDNILVLEEDFTRVGTDKTISQSLGISVSDIDFAADKRTNDIPFWRRRDLFGPEKLKDERSNFRGKSDVQVTLHNNHNDHVQHEGVATFDIGKDRISDVHKDMLLKLRRGPVSLSGSNISPLVIDSNLHHRLDINNKLQSHDSDWSLLMHDGFNAKKPDFGNEGKRGEEQDILKVLDEISTHIDALKSDKDNRNKGDKIAGIVNENDSTDGVKEVKTGTEPSEGFDEIFYRTECSKRPLSELGPQYFLLYVMYIGYIPFTCHGNTVYDDTLCACMPALEDTAYDEATFPTKECTKTAVPELGPQFFQDHLLGVGYIPYVCHGKRVYDDRQCACVYRRK